MRQNIGFGETARIGEIEFGETGIGKIGLGNIGGRHQVQRAQRRTFNGDYAFSAKWGNFYTLPNLKL